MDNATAPTAYDPAAPRAARGLDIVRTFLDTNLPDNQAVFADAITDVLHAADGWHAAPTVLQRALTLASATEPPRITADTSPRDLEALAGAVATLLDAAHDATGICPNALADWAETTYQDEVDRARFDYMRQIRQV